MKNRHITEILDNTAFGNLTETDKTIVSAHIKICVQCREAFEAARVSSVLLKAEASAADFIPSPFFQAKVMNLWRERQNLRQPIAVFRRWWQAAAAPVFMMLAIVGVLISLTLAAPKSNAEGGDAPVEVSSFSLYPTDAVTLNQKPLRDLTTEQVFQTIYDRRK